MQKQTPLESPDLSSLWLSPSFSLEEKGRPAWGHVMAVQGDTGRASQALGLSPNIGQCLLGWNQICPDY